MSASVFVVPSARDRTAVSAFVTATAALVGEAAAVVHEEAAPAGELVSLLRHHADAQLLARQVGTGELEGLGGLALVHIHRAGLALVATGLELLERILRDLVRLGAPWSVVISCHGYLP